MSDIFIWRNDMLKLKKLSLCGFGIFKNYTEFNFENGVNLLVAENGKGKSTILNCIEMLLLDNYQGNFADYINTYCNEFEVSLEFYLNGKYLIETLSCKKTNKTCTTFRNLKDVDGNDIANGEDVKNYLNKFLPQTTTKYSLFVRQKNGIDVINATDSERRDLFKRIQDLDYSKEMDLLINPKIENVKQSIIEIEKEIFSLENKKYEIKNYIDLPFIKEEYNIKKNKLDKLNVEKALVEERKARFDELIINKNKIVNEITSIENISVSKKTSIINCNEFIENSESEKDKIITRCEMSKIESSKKIIELNASIDNLDDEKNDKIKEINNNIVDIKKEMESIESELLNIKLVKLIKFDESPLINARNNLSELKTKSSIAWKNAEQLKNNICPICGSDCKGQHENFENEAKSYDKQVIECQKTIDDLIEKKNNYEESSKKNQENKELKMNFESKISTLEEKLSTYKNSLNNLDTIYESKTNEIKSKIVNEEQKYFNEEQKCTSDCKAIDDKVDLYKKQKSEYEFIIAENDKKIIELNKELKEVNKKLLEYDNSNKIDFSEIDSLSSELKKYDDIVSQNKIIKNHNEEIESTKKLDKIDLEKFKEKKQKFENEKFNLESAKKIMQVDYPNWFISNSLRNIENSLNEFIDEVYYKPLNVHFEQTKTGIRMEYGNRLKIHRLSGAETSICNVGFASTFSNTLELGCILLDEVDGPIHENIKPQFAETLLNMNSMFEQIFIISHDSKFRDYIIANNSDTNVITL